MSLLAAYLLLPPTAAGFDLPVVPTLDRDTIPGLAALAIVLLLYRSEVRLWPESRMARALVVLFVLSPVGTTLANGDPLHYGVAALPGMKVQEFVALIILQVATLTPFLLARALLVGEAGQRLLLGALVTATLLYSLPMLVEVRLSPQINLWVYGFFQHSFAQMMRDGGFRPLVFLYHGLWAAFLVATAFLAALVLLRSSGAGPARGRLLFAAPWLLGTLVLCKSLGSLLYGVATAPLVLLAPARLQLTLALGLAALAFAYPVLRGANLVPVAQITELAAKASPDRAQSLGFRFENEEMLLVHARERPIFGWGSWGRHMVYGPRSADPLTVADGRWIVTLGTWGWAGYLGEFGLLLLPVWLAWRRRGRASRVTAGAALILAVNLVDMIPNATLTPITWLFAGAILGWAERPDEAREAVPARRAPALRVVMQGGGPIRPRI